MQNVESDGWLKDILVVEIGSRVSAGVCGSLLADAGATVLFIEPMDPDQLSIGKWPQRALLAAGKHSIRVDGGNRKDIKLLKDLVLRADILLQSSDIDAAVTMNIIEDSAEGTIKCDFTAFGSTGPLAGKPYTEEMIQALTGVAYTTGFQDNAPVVLKVPVVEYSTAIYGAVACVAALIERDQSGTSQSIDMALYDCAINSLATFLPAYFGGGEPRRAGNQHSICAPWDTYLAIDGWVQICSASDSSWRKICEAMDRPDLVDDPKFLTLRDRVDNRAEINSIVQGWVGKQQLNNCMDILQAYDIAYGPILSLDEIHKNVNLKHRAMIQNLHDPQSGRTIQTPGVVWKSDIKRRQAPQHIPAPDSYRKFLDNLLNGQKEISDQKERNSLPLAGVRVLEIGQYTTAPLSCRHLASLGAEVLKIEPLSGDAARQWQPSINGQSLFFVMSNSGKKSYAIDLNQAEGAAIFADLLSTADILVENLKPGSLAKRGFSLEKIREINSSLIYCAISGFGTDSAYQERPAFDTVIQAMSGMMDANSFEGTPLKAGISAGDFLGGQIGLFALLSAFRARKGSGFGEFIDISMQDIAAWTTAPLWNPDDGDAKYITHLIDCRDGHVLISGTCAELVYAKAAELKDNDLTREELVASLNEENLDCVPVLSVSEAATHEQTVARELIVWCQSDAGDAWPLLGTPLRLSRTRPVVENPIGDAITIDEEVAAQLGIGPYSKN